MTELPSTAFLDLFPVRKKGTICSRSTAAVSFVTSTRGLRSPEKPNLQRQAEAFQNAQPASSPRQSGVACRQCPDRAWPVTVANSAQIKLSCSKAPSIRSDSDAPSLPTIPPPHSQPRPSIQLLFHSTSRCVVLGIESTTRTKGGHPERLDVASSGDSHTYHRSSEHALASRPQLTNSFSRILARTEFKSSKMAYYCNGYRYNTPCNNGLGYGPRIGIGVAIAVGVVLLIILFSLLARKRRRRFNQQSTLPMTYQQNQTSNYQQGYGGGGYGQGYGQPYGTQQSSYAYGQQPAYGPPAGAPPTGGDSYAPPPGPPPPAYVPSHDKPAESARV
ncbi:hypothetical protein PHSY_004191 [Pseudozyma hubeiensis SY62]|uniref:Uncharacterized protein n=1 Tax=Pseudozyma hubeiensis (strain SY62) TaxID=1305764 RepID=R9P595_PSEHS|nr:hypothetical protein PHSY_004191 [Pseudozyma hubeiensis SY62]GAC96608.1 hypothetical protein PHSY_004191 [Pseudozyma hubeiensis SY62]